jgi:hypothetical protein
MHWRQPLLAGLALAGIVILAMLMEWFAGAGPSEHYVPLLIAPDIVVTPTCAARCWRAVDEAPTP